MQTLHLLAIIKMLDLEALAPEDRLSDEGQRHRAVLPRPAPQHDVRPGPLLRQCDHAAHGVDDLSMRLEQLGIATAYVLRATLRSTYQSRTNYVTRCSSITTTNQPLLTGSPQCDVATTSATAHHRTSRNGSCRRPGRTNRRGANAAECSSRQHATPATRRRWPARAPSPP